MRRRELSVITVAVAVVLGAGIAGCGSSPRPSVPRTVHLNGKATGDYVSEVSASGMSFLVPAAALASQGSQTFDVVATANRDQAGVVASATTSSTGPINPSAPYRWIVASATAVVRRDAHVELLATGRPGQQFALQWTDTCGGQRIGAHGVAGGNGGSGELALRSPAVVELKLPPSTGIDTCYVAAVATARTFNSFRVGILDY